MYYQDQDQDHVKEYVEVSSTTVGNFGNVCLIKICSVYLQKLDRKIMRLFANSLDDTSNQTKIKAHGIHLSGNVYTGNMNFIIAHQ